jgi:LmbE family N-acetylglucosaminyl deacetylase
MAGRPLPPSADWAAVTRDCVVFVHAHPDDEAIFTGGTMVRLAEAGTRVVLVIATGGELGEAPAGLAGGAAATAAGATGAETSTGNARPTGAETSSGDDVGRIGAGKDEIPGLAERRRAETDAAARALGISRVAWLGYRDSGMAGDPGNEAPGSLCSAEVGDAAGRLARVLAEERPAAVVVYDGEGIYGHPDHVAVHRLGHRAAAAAGVATVYETTVDREYLHFVETHLVEEAILAGDLGLVRSHIGLPTVAIDLTVDVRPALDAKRAAMAAHASQIPESTSALQLPADHFADVYGWEWYVRSGPPGPLDGLTRSLP